MLQEHGNNILKECWRFFYLFKQFHTALEKNISRNTLYDNVDYFFAIHKVEEWKLWFLARLLRILLTLI